MALDERYYVKAKEKLLYSDGNLINESGVVADIVSGKYKQVNITVDGVQRSLYSHKVVWYIFNGDIPEFVDHINRNSMDNTICNLRPANKYQNALNRMPLRGRFKGVYYNKGIGKFHAQCNSLDKRHIGFFDDELEAAVEYDRKLLDHLSDSDIVFAYLNSIGGCLPDLKDIEELKLTLIGE